MPTKIFESRSVWPPPHSNLHVNRTRRKAKQLQKSLRAFACFDAAFRKKDCRAAAHNGPAHSMSTIVVFDLLLIKPRKSRIARFCILVQRKQSESTLRLKHQCHFACTTPAEPEVCRVSLWRVVESFVRDGNRERHHFELKKTPFAKRLQGGMAIWIYASR